MRRIISALLLCFSTTMAVAQSTRPLELVPDAPDRHIVVPGDTLWGISGKFLQNPYRWPEIWRLNPEEIRNPHRIYPGQVVVLDRSGADPRLKLGKVFKAEPRIYSDAEQQEIPAIPQNVIEPFLSQPLIIEDGSLATAPRVVAVQENRVNVGAGGEFYVDGIPKPASVKLWQVYRPGAVLKDPDNGAVLGHEAFYLGAARVVREGAAGEAATLEVLTSKEEIGRGDSLMPAAKPEIISYAPHAPTALIKGRIINIYGGVGEAGRHSVVTLSRGMSDGLERGHVLAIHRTGATVTNKFEDSKPKSVKLPDERFGLLFVFRVFDRVSYALVMESSRPVMPGDTVQTP